MSTLKDFILNHVTSLDFSTVSTVIAQKCTTVEDLIEIYKKDLTLTQSFIDCLKVGLAVHISSKIDGDPIWIYLVGAPSSGKSTLCELLGSDEFHTKPLSKFTGLVSGHRQGTHLAPLLNGKCTIVKDGTLLLESSPQELANVYGELRDIYDGSLEAHYRNGREASIKNVNFSMIVGMTERIYGISMAALGERFIHCRLESTEEADKIRNQRAVLSVLQGSKLTMTAGSEEGDTRSFPVQQQYTAGFLQHLHSKISENEILKPKFTDEDVELILSIGRIIACSRAQAAVGQDGEIAYNSKPESATRSIKVISKTALCLCYVLGVTSFTPEIRRLLLKLTADTAYGRQYEVLKTISLSEFAPSRHDLAAKTLIPQTSMNRILSDLCSMGVIIEAEESSRQGRVGRKNKVLKCPKWITSSFKTLDSYAKSFEDTQTKKLPKKKLPTKKKPLKKRSKVAKKKSPRKR